MPTTYKVIFYNVENLFDPADDSKTTDEEFTPNGTNKYDDARYQIHLEHTAKVLTSMLETEQPLFIGLSEIENKKVLEDLVKTTSLHNYNLGIVHQESPDARGIDVGLIYNKDVFTLISQEFITVKLADDADFKTRDILHAKGTLKNGEMIDVFVNHWPSRREGQVESEPRRIAAASILKAATDKLLSANPNANILMMGDFNDYPTDKSILNTLGATPVSEMNPGSKLYNIIQKPATGAIQGSHFYNKEWGFLDQMMVSKALLDGKKTDIMNKKAEVFYRDFMIYTNKEGIQAPNKFYVGSKYIGGYSDHFPVCTSVSIAK
jgi:predicted extracellular nuclease